MLHYWWMIPLGFALGVLGTIIGAGGGFLLVPILLILYPAEAPEVITGISLAMVCANAVSGSVSYARQGRIDFRAGLIFAAAGVPGAVFGALATKAIPRLAFDVVFGVVLLALALVLILRASARPAERGPGGGTPAPDPGVQRTLVLRRGALVSVAVSLIASTLGVGGGIIHVPAMVYLLGYSVHAATATSHFVLAITSFAGVTAHVATGAFHHGVHRAVMLSIGVVVGAPIGARLSTHLGSAWIIRGLAAALLIAGTRLVRHAFGV